MATPIHASLRLQVITDPALLPSLAPAWRALLAASGRPEPMQSPDWLLPWWRRYACAGGCRLRVGLFWSDANLVGIAPLCRRPHRYRAGLVFRRLELLGANGQESDGVCSEYLGLCVAPEWEAAVIDCFAAQLHRGGFGPWDELVLDALDGDRPQTAALALTFRERDVPVTEQVTMQAPYVALPQTWDAFIAQLPKSRRWNLRTQQKDFEAWAAGTARWHAATTPGELDEARAILERLHEERWRHENKRGAFASPRFRGFHEEFMAGLLRQGKLELIWLEAHGRAVAALYAFREAGKVYFYQSGRVMDVPPRVRLGSILVAAAIRRAIERGDREFDMLGGDAGYKLAFTRTTRPLVRLRVAQPSLVEIARSWAEKLQRTARALRSLILGRETRRPS